MSHSKRAQKQLQLSFPKLCACGCGQPVNARWVRGHHGRRPLAERFWEKVHICGKDECWEWQGALRDGKYGCICVDGKTQLAHRIAFLLDRGYLPEDKDICHSCDNRRCCNPSHLWEGIEADNIADMIAKGRRRADYLGSKNVWAKLTEADIPEIRRLAREGVTYEEIGGRFGIKKANVSSIVLGKAWKHVS